MSPTPCIGLLVIDDEIVAAILEGWPSGVLKPRLVAFDHAGNDVLVNTGLKGREVFPVEYEPGGSHPSPSEILAVLDARSQVKDSFPLRVARRVRQSILELDERLNRLEQAPTGDDYNRLYVVANGGLIDLLKVLGNPTDFGD